MNCLLGCNQYIDKKHQSIQSEQLPIRKQTLILKKKEEIVSKARGISNKKRRYSDLWHIHLFVLFVEFDHYIPLHNLLKV